jgi:hypothetical protein
MKNQIEVPAIFTDKKQDLTDGNINEYDGRGVAYNARTIY